MFRTLPGELVADRSVTSVLGLDGRTQVLLVAGPDASGGMTVTAVTDAWTETLWPPETTPPKPVTGRADLVALGDGRALALIPGQALLHLDPLAESEAARAVPLKPGRTRLPDRMFATGEAVTGLWLRARCKTLLATLDPAGGRDRDSERAGPVLMPGQAVNLVLRDGAGRDVVVAEDRRTGLHVWRQDAPGGWAHLSDDGAARHGLNAAAACGLLWGERVVLATASTAAVRHALPGMPLRGELIALDPDGRLQLLTGELRTSANGLMVPELSAAAVMTLGAGQIAHLGRDAAGRLILAMDRPDGEAVVFALAPDMTLTTLADTCDTVLGLVPDRAAPGGIAIVSAL